MMKHQDIISIQPENGYISLARQGLKFQRATPAGRGATMKRHNPEYNNMNAYIYCSTTTHDPVVLEAQKIACIAYCKREGLAVAKVFSDANISSFTIGTGLHKLIRACRTGGGKVRHLVLYQTADSAWVMRVLADALMPAVTAEPSQQLKGEDYQCLA